MVIAAIVNYDGLRILLPCDEHAKIQEFLAARSPMLRCMEVKTLVPFRQTNIAIDSVAIGLYPFLLYLSMIDEAKWLTRRFYLNSGTARSLS